VLTTRARSPEPPDAPGLRFGGGIRVGTAVGPVATGEAAGDAPAPGSGDENGFGGGNRVGEAAGEAAGCAVGAPSMPHAVDIIMASPQSSKAARDR
jgi:hypothetical protein